MCMCFFLSDEKGYGVSIPGKLQEEKRKKKTYVVYDALYPQGSWARWSLKVRFWSITKWSVSQFQVALYYLVHRATAQEY